jgi:hypothetical protein
LTEISGAFAVWFLNVYKFVRDVIFSLLSRYPFLRRPFEGSVFPIFTVNFGPFSFSFDHRDWQNAPGVPCAITALGDFDWKRGGHLVLYDYRLVIVFPPGSTAEILSGCVRHGNTPIQAGESRMSLIQYMAGGLWRHVAYGFRLQNQLSKAEKAEEKASASLRWQAVVSLFSTVSSLARDRLHLSRLL